MKIDCCGHTMNKGNIERDLESDIRIWKKVLADRPEVIPEIFKNPFHTSSSCFACGDSPRFKTEDQGESFVAETECQYKDGFPPIEVMLEVPSGEILLFNDLRHCYEQEKEHIDVNSTLGIKLHTEHYAKQGMITHFVGNSSPGVFQVSDERLEIRSGYCEKEDGCTLPECPMPSCGMSKKLGSICTDLWWYCAVDKDEFEKRIWKTTEQYKEEYPRGSWPDIIRAKVIPGTYRTVGQYHIDSEKLYSFIERIK